MPEPIVTLSEESLRPDPRELVRRTVEEVLDGLLDEEAGDLVGAERYERTADREAYRAGHYERKLATTSGEVTIRMPKLKGMRFTAAIIERYRRREASVEEAMIEMYLAGASTRRIEDVSEMLWGSSVSAATVSNLNEKAFEAVEERRNGPLERAYPYACVDGIYLKRSWGGSYENVAVMVAIGVNDDGCREVIGAAEGFTESSECWRELLSWLRSRGLRGVRMFTGDEAAGMVSSIAEVFPGGRLPALHRPLLQERAGEGAEDEAREGRRDAQGDPRHGVARGVGEEGRRGCRRAGVHEARGSREDRPRGLRRDPDVHGIPRRPLEEDPHQQHHRAAQPGNPQANAGGRDLPRRKVRPHARDGEAEVRRGERVGLPPLPGRDAAGRVAAPDGGPMGLSESAQES